MSVYYIGIKCKAAFRSDDNSKLPKAMHVFAPKTHASFLCQTVTMLKSNYEQELSRLFPNSCYEFSLPTKVPPSRVPSSGSAPARDRSRSRRGRTRARRSADSPV